MSEANLINPIASHRFPLFQNQNYSIWNHLPISRRSAVFILLFLGKLGELRVVLTKRSSKLRSFPGHVALPGGKADNGLETEYAVARREMEEEIGLSSNNEILKSKFGFEILHLNIMPSYLLRTFLAVRPCIGFMKFDDISEQTLIHNLEVSLNPGESSSVFSCPLRDFLFPISEQPSLECIDKLSFRLSWGNIPGNLRSYSFPQNVPGEAEWLKTVMSLLDSEDEVEIHEKSEKLALWGRLGSRRDSDTNEKIYDVWGLTANILHDLANLVYTKNAVNSEFGEEELIYSLWKYGNQMKEKRRSEEESKLINNRGRSSEFGFNDVLPRTEFNRLKKLYSSKI